MRVRLVGGSTGSRSLRSVRSTGTRPTSGLVRGALFGILAPHLHQPRVLDLFAGTGALGLEALSRGAVRVDFVESNLRQCVALRAGLRAQGHEPVTHVHWTRVERALGFLTGPYDLVVMDPPYAYAGTAALLERIAGSALVAEEGILATPPMVLSINWSILAVTYLTLVTVAALTAAWLAWLTAKLEVHRVLRIGEG